MRYARHSGYAVFRGFTLDQERGLVARDLSEV